MPEQRLLGVIETLRREEQDIASKLGEVKAKAEELEKDLARVRGAITSLDGSPSGKTVAKRKSGSPRKPAPKKEDVIQAVTLLLREHGVIEREKLYGAVENVMANNGRSKMGLKLRFEEALQDSRFDISAFGVGLVKEEEARTQVAPTVGGTPGV